MRTNTGSKDRTFQGLSELMGQRNNQMRVIIVITQMKKKLLKLLVKLYRVLFNFSKILSLKRILSLIFSNLKIKKIILILTYVTDRKFFSPTFRIKTWLQTWNSTCCTSSWLCTGFDEKLWISSDGQRHLTWTNCDSDVIFFRIF